MPLRTLTAVCVRARLGGSSSPVLVETNQGLFVVRLRGAGQGIRALIAEIIVAGLAVRLGLPVPECVLIDLSPGVPSHDHNDELKDLLERSAGMNLGFRFLDGAVAIRTYEVRSLDDEFALRVLWLDGLVMNPDRTAKNPNILMWKRRPWLIDHGAALPFQHYWQLVTEDIPREPTDPAGHVFADRAALLPRIDEALALEFDRQSLDRVLAEVPEAFLAEVGPEARASRSRAAYQAFLWKRLKPPRPFV